MNAVGGPCEANSERAFASMKQALRVQRQAAREREAQRAFMAAAADGFLSLRTPSPKTTLK
jgi:hypothetical protein